MAAYGWTEDYVLFELSGARGWAYYAAAIEINPWLSAERASDGYIAQEIRRRTINPISAF